MSNNQNGIFCKSTFSHDFRGKRAILTRPYTSFKATPCFKIKENLILLWNPNSNLRGTWCTKQGRGQSLFRVFFSNFPQILPFVYTSLYPSYFLFISYRFYSFYSFYTYYSTSYYHSFLIFMFNLHATIYISKRHCALYLLCQRGEK